MSKIGNPTKNISFYLFLNIVRKTLLLFFRFEMFPFEIFPLERAVKCGNLNSLRVFAVSKSKEMQKELLISYNLFMHIDPFAAV
jgi:hypothetical protein